MRRYLYKGAYLGFIIHDDIVAIECQPPPYSRGVLACFRGQGLLARFAPICSLADGDHERNVPIDDSFKAFNGDFFCLCGT